MTVRKRALRLLTLACVSLATIFLCTFLAVQFEQRLLRYRAERLMADMHSIRLYQTTWADAQRLMHKWGAWGHYDGTCTAADCFYKIGLGAPLWALNQNREPNWLERNPYFLRGLSIMGRRMAAIEVGFRVHNGTIWRTSADVVLDVPPPLKALWNLNPEDAGDLEYELIIQTKSRQSLQRSAADEWILGNDEELSVHPWYKAGRPSGCENCFAAHVTYSTHAPSEVIRQISNFNFSCFTQWRPCRFLGDLLPIAREWRFYGKFEPGWTPDMELPPPPRTCDVPLWALSRDHNSIFSVETLTNGVEKAWDGSMHEADTVRVLSTLKNSSWRNGRELKAIPYWEDPNSPELGLSEHLQAHRRYLLIYQDHYDDPPAPWLALDRCGIWEDTPANRADVAKGMAFNDNLPSPELR